MYRAVVILLMCGLAAPAAWAKSALDLMLEGRYSEAKAILDATVASPRYQLMYFALTESEAARACSLYQVIAIRYPNTDCDSVARVRLDQAREMGVMVVPINEWAEAPAGVKPLGMRRMAQLAPPPSPVAERPVTTAMPTTADTIVHPSVPGHLLDTTHVSKVAITREKIAEQSVTLTVPFSQMEKSDSGKPQMKDSTKKIIPSVSAKIAHRDTTIIEKSETKKESLLSPPVEVKPKVAEPVVSAPKVESPLPVQGKPKVAEPVVSASKVEAPPVQPSVASAETLKAVKAETPKAVSDTSSVANNVEPLKPKIVLHDKPIALPGKWYIQVGAFADFDNAHRLATSLQKAGYPIKLVPRDAGTKKLLQVRVGGYENRDDCNPVAAELKSKYHVPAVIISE